MGMKATSTNWISTFTNLDNSQLVYLEELIQFSDQCTHIFTCACGWQLLNIFHNEKNPTTKSNEWVSIKVTALYFKSVKLTSTFALCTDIIFKTFINHLRLESEHGLHWWYAVWLIQHIEKSEEGNRFVLSTIFGQNI